jgi:hypothetical protein
MAENVDNMILEQLRLIRSDMARMEGKIDDLEVGQQSMQGIIMAVGHSLHVLDHRVEQLEEKIGGDQ